MVHHLLGVGPKDQVARGGLLLGHNGDQVCIHFQSVVDSGIGKVVRFHFFHDIFYIVIHQVFYHLVCITVNN